MFVLHVGAGKCGSSALQKFFSHNPTVRAGNSLLAYQAAVNGEVISGDVLKEKAKRNPRGYVASQNFKSLCEFSLRDKLSQLPESVRPAPRNASNLLNCMAI